MCVGVVCFVFICRVVVLFCCFVVWCCVVVMWCLLDCVRWMFVEFDCWLFGCGIAADLVIWMVCCLLTPFVAERVCCFCG